MDGLIFAVAGKPILHSKSPVIFNYIFEKLGKKACYTRILAENPGEIFQLIQDLNLKGLNVTAPFKEKVLPYLHRLSEEAKILRSANTIRRNGNELEGFNTDFLGAADSLKASGIVLKGKKALILGAGGAGRAAAFGLMREGARVRILNRNPEKAEKVAKELRCSYGDLKRIEVYLKEADILISCLPSRFCPVEPGILKRNLIVLDANYKFSPLAVEARKRGCKVIDGIQWLIHQALPAFEIFLNRSIKKEDVLPGLFSYSEGIKKRNVTLIGFMGTGKSYIGRYLSKFLGMSFVDTDILIERKAGMPIPLIFKKYGEGYFRKIEKQVIEEVFQHSNQIISSGGGAVEDPQNRRIIRENSLVLWLWSSLEVCLGRIQNYPRPLLEGESSREKAEKLLKRRLFLYAVTSHLLIYNNGLDAAERARRLADEIRDAF